ncbi:hypothetical protein WJX79_008088 [Trebouxia sp. C0005]
MATGAGSSEEQAALLAEQGEFAAAICRYKLAIAERPDCAILFEQLAQCLLETEQYPEAYQAASEALTLAPQWPDALLTLARCSFNTGLLPDANHKFSQYLDTQPHNVEVQAELAEVKHLQQQQLALAVGLPGLQIEQSYGAQGGPGHVVWEAGIVLSRYFVSHPDLVRGKRVLELGCGTGVVGITLACLGADVTLTDIAAIIHCSSFGSVPQIVLLQLHTKSGLPVDWTQLGLHGPCSSGDKDRLCSCGASSKERVILVTSCRIGTWKSMLCCACRRFDLEGIIQDMLTCCREAIAAAQARQDIYLEEAASQGKDSAVKQSGIWLGMLEAVCLRACGNATPTIEQMTQMPPTDPVRTCATSLVNILVRLAEAYETLETPDLAESALRQALEYASLTGRPRKEQKALLALSRTFEYHQTARRQQSVRDKAAIYRQHLFAAAPNLA